MALSWWPVAVVGFACLTAAVALAVLPSVDSETRQLRPLANTARLTRLPEYARVARTRLLSVIVAIVLLLILFAAAVLASARPSGWWSSRTDDAPHDIMLCVGQPVTDQTTAAFLSHFAGQTRTYGTQRIGLTSPNRRVIPLTRDYAYAAERLTDLAEVGRTPADPELTPAQRSAKRGAIASFSPAVSYLDYAPSAADLLALCITGFPSFDAPSTHRRSLIYLGPGELRAPGETRAALFDDQQVANMAREAGIQVNLLATSPGGLRDIAESTGGQYVSLDTGDAGMTRALDGIGANPPEPTAEAEAVTAWYGDSPTLPLTVAVVASLLLALALVVLRR